MGTCAVLTRNLFTEHANTIVCQPARQCSIARENSDSECLQWVESGHGPAYRDAMKIAVEEGRLVVSGHHGGEINFADITHVAAEKVGKITYDEVFLIVRGQSGNAVTLGELDTGFADAEKTLRARLTDFPSNWWAAAKQAPVGVREQIWPSRV